MLRTVLLTIPVVFMTAFFAPDTARAGEAVLPITVTLVKCGEYKSDIPRACYKDERCCAFMEPYGFNDNDLKEFEPQIINLAYQTPVEKQKISYTAPQYIYLD